MAFLKLFCLRLHLRRENPEEAREAMAVILEIFYQQRHLCESCGLWSCKALGNSFCFLECLNMTEHMINKLHFNSHHVLHQNQVRA